MSSTIGNHLKMTIFGESHGEAIGVTLDGLPAGIQLDFSKIMIQMNRRAPGNHSSSTARKEADIPKILSGVLNGVTTGAPLCAVIENTNTHSKDYENLTTVPRPSHSDYTANIRYNGFNDIRGGGHFSGRLTAPLVFAGAICRQILETKGIIVGGHVYSIGEIHDTPFDMCAQPLPLTELSAQYFAVQDEAIKEKMVAKIEEVKSNQDSIGGIIEVAAFGLPAGIGSPMFFGVEGVISSYIFGIPAVKGVEFGAGFDIATKLGSEANDKFIIENDTVKTSTNNCGGILGGITSGMPLIVRAAFKPTPSISKTQKSVNLNSMKETDLIIKGRHDPCIVPRALPCVEAAVAIALVELLMERGKL